MTGTIIKGIGGFYYIKLENGEVVECKARGKFRNNKISPMVGDKVKISVDNKKGVIEDILPRSSMLMRPNVANVTQAFIVFSTKKPDINFYWLDKFVVLCESKELDIVVCVNKIDLAEPSELNKITEYLSLIGYPYCLIGAKENNRIDELKKYINNNVTVVCGPSGVGKSTLTNSLCGYRAMETGDISEKLKRGKHTTRHCELIEVEGGLVVDTPGFSSLDLSEIDKDDVKYFFREFQDYADNCKFRGCNHDREPGCAVKKAVDDGKIARIRYESYLSIVEEVSKKKLYD
ncbi:ribosome small subunit-dependent GTPase A [Clostridium oryzae]|uniref:Small ribosomal subunit biogenesis GTPase RsgA n=1 Tax=Clostridium oryzae TaxID=1450648 RepID=A0A1V4IP06_9CLOT|nr:ribosome small subunit-dependent GTPase A [Clostridium oryzae]OPJ61761.1 putative ribosome biogenesis GTPase RsgA [Clostridium oryzae]